MREEQKKILGKGNARPKLSFSLIGPADSQQIEIKKVAMFIRNSFVIMPFNLK